MVYKKTKVAPLKITYIDTYIPTHIHSTLFSVRMLGSILGQGIFFSVLICNKKKGEDNFKLVPNLSYSNSLVDMRVILGVFRHAESKSSLYLVLSLFLKEVLVILLEPLTVVSGF